MRTAYSGSAIRVRRSSDNTESDIGFDGNGNLDTATLKTFVGANNGFVTKWYDQSGNARDAAQTTAANQPRIINAGLIDRQNTKPSIVFDGSNDNMSLPFFLSEPFTISSVAKGSGSDNSIIRRRETTGAQADFGLTTSQIARYTLSSGNRRILFTAITNQFLLTSIETVSRTGEAFINNSSVGTAAAISSYPVSNWFIGSNGSNIPNLLNGNIQEIIVYNSNQSSNRTGIESNINSFYSIY